MKVLLVHHIIRVSDTEVTFGAVDYYRMQKPAEVLFREFGVEYATVDSLNIDEDWIKQFDLVFFSRTIKDSDLEKVKLWGIPFALDLDDYWFLEEDHILYDAYKQNKTPELIIRSIKEAHFVTCTTDILAEKIKEHNQNVYVIENGIDTGDPVWKLNRIQSDRVRFGFTGGSTHIPDILEVSKDVSRSLYDRNFYHKAQVVVCGFNAEHLKPSVYIGYERELTDDLKPLKFLPDYVKDLKSLGNPDGTDKPYRRVWNKDISEFPVIYDEIDVVVAPLKDSLFNRCKSNIKMLEAGFKGCAVMVSGIPPYMPLATKENSFLLSEKNFFEWQRYILNNPAVLEDKRAALRESVEPYSLKNITKRRYQVYESCIGVLK